MKVPKLKGIPFETAIIERYRCREASVEEALIKCIWLVFPFDVWKTSPKLYGE